MKLLVMAPLYMNLYKPIVEELRKQGHEVRFIEDKELDWNWRIIWKGKKRYILRLFYFIIQKHQNYWRKVFEYDSDIDRSFDGVIVINGCSFHPYFLKRLKRHNPNLFSTLYLWDNSSFFDYYTYKNSFDKVFTYDIDDSIKYKAELLPFYWQDSTKYQDLPTKYSISMIGTNHSNRLEIVKDMIPWLEQNGLSYFFRIVDKSIPEDEIVSHSQIPQEEVCKIISESKCILDTDRPSQSGTTPRLIWALSMSKKIITTNANIRRMPFYDEKYVYIIDRSNLKLDNKSLSFIQESSVSHINDSINHLRIDNWVNILLRLKNLSHEV